MKIVLITDSKLKVRLSRDDLEYYGIKIENIDYDNTETRRVFWSILDEAKQRTGFDAAISRIFIQIYPDGDGGCDMYVSHIGGDGGGSEKKRGVVCSVEAPELESRIYALGCMKELIGACRRLLDVGFKGRSSAFCSLHGEQCFLVIETEGAEWDIASEFGERLNGKGALSYIREHCTVICSENAAETLGEM
ncbi:MAG: adaptor protein MecA [Clostridia bacterium]|nr:adaptor protein MecA [Clostridia bacterium]